MLNIRMPYAAREWFSLLGDKQGATGLGRQFLSFSHPIFDSLDLTVIERVRCGHA
jgi:hypothetical protein